MSDKIRPRPTQSHPLWDWTILDNMVHEGMKTRRHNGEQPWTRVDTSMYEMDHDEILNELRKVYNVREEGGTSLFIT